MTKRGETREGGEKDMRAKLREWRSKRERRRGEGEERRKKGRGKNKERREGVGRGEGSRRRSVEKRETIEERREEGTKWGR